jgi:3-oxoacyl-[acyl-carrier protein] reductase
MMKLAGKVALVTGAGRGIGRATALKLASEGAMLVVNDLDGAPAADTVKEIVEAGGKAVACVGSVIEPGFAEHFVETGLDRFGGLDILVNNAGYQWDSRIEDATDEQLDAMYEVHVKGQFRMLRAAIGPIKKLRAHELSLGRNETRKIVNVSSISGTMGNAGQANYASGKAAVVGLTKTVAKEWGQFKVNVNAVAFGWIETRLTASKDSENTMEIDGEKVQLGIPEQMRTMAPMLIPIGRPGTPEEAAGGVFFLCSPWSNFVHGQVLNITGGQFTGMTS